MEPTFNTSFIPKHTAGEPPRGVLPQDKRVRRRAAYGFGFFVSLLMFFLSGISAIGVFVYTQIVQQTVEQQIVEVTELSAQLKPETTQSLIRDDVRLKETRRLLMNHVVLSGLLEELEAVTLQEVQYLNATFALGDNVPTLVLNGTTRDYTRVAGQTKRFEGHGSFPLPVITSLERGEGDVSFTLSTQIDPVLVRFGDAIDRGIYRGEEGAPAATPAATTPAAAPEDAAEATASTSAPAEQGSAARTSTEPDSFQ